MPDIGELLRKRIGGGAPAEEMPPEAPADDAGLSDPVQDAASDLIAAVQAGDAGGVAAAMRAAFQAMEMEPHLEAGESE